VAQFKKVESNDTGKTDHKDPRVMHLVARLGKAQRHRHLPETYRKLRRLIGRAIKHRSKYTHFETLRHLFSRAELSARYQLACHEIELITARLKALW